MSHDFNGFSKEMVESFFDELSKELKKEFGRNASVELIVVGGASILLNYHFRNSTIDIDAVVASRMSIKDAINRVGDKFSLPNGWLNSDFRQTKSYSPKLIQYSKFYKSYNQVLTVRTIEAEYLVAMKLTSLRPYKNDKSDIVGIIQEEESRRPLSYEKIDKAVIALYGAWEKLPKSASDQLNNILRNIENPRLYAEIKEEEENSKELLQDFESQYDNVLKEDNLDEILLSLKQKESTVFKPKKEKHHKSIGPEW